MKTGKWSVFCGVLFFMTHMGLISSWGGYYLSGTRHQTPAPIWSISSSDLDGNGREEIVLGGIDHHIYVVDGKGRMLWTFDVMGLPLDIKFGDVNNDGKPEIVVASQDQMGSLYVLEYKKGLLWKYGGKQAFLSAAIGDIEGDGKKEVVGGTMGGFVYVLDDKGKLKWKKQIVRKSSVGAVAVGNITGDKGQEVVCGTRKEGVWALDRFGTTLWHMDDRKALDRYVRHWVRSVLIDDIDNDGRSEVLIGSRPSGMVTVLSGKGNLLWHKNFPQVVNKSSNAEIHVGNFTGDAKKEIVCLLRGIVFEGAKGTSPIAILDNQGHIILKDFSEKNFFSSAIMAEDETGYSKILLSSSTRGGGFYQIKVEPLKGGSSPRLFPEDTDNLDQLYREVEIKPKKRHTAPTSASSSQVHVLYPYKGDMNEASIKKLMNFLKKLESPPLSYELMITHMYEKKGKKGDKRKQPKWTGKRGTLSQGEILNAVRLYESLKIPFYVLIGKGCSFNMRLQTMEMILETAPRFCKGFIVNEDIYTHKRKFGPFLEQIEQILNILLRYGNKKLIMNEYMDFWAKVPTMPGIEKRLFNDRYKDVLVPMYKSNRVVVPEQNIGMIMGLWKAGIVGQWGFCANDDLWKWEAIFMNPPHDVLLRMEVMAASLGATYFRIEANREFIEQKDGQWVISEGAKRHRRLFHTLVTKGIVRPIDDPKQVLISPVMLRVTYDESLWPQNDESADVYWQNVYSRPRTALSYAFPLQVVHEKYIPSDIYHLEHFYDGLFPETPFGFVGMVPKWLSLSSVPGVKEHFLISGEYIYKKDGSKVALEPGRKAILAALEKYARRLPFQANNVFMAINDFEDGYLLYLMDPGHLQISDVDTRLSINLSADNPKIMDAISGEMLTSKDRQVDIRIPAGTFRILYVPDAKGSQQQNDMNSQN